MHVVSDQIRIKHAIAVMAIRFEFWMFKKYLICTVFPVLIRLVQNWFFFLVIKICFSTYMQAACDLHNLYLYERFFSGQKQFGLLALHTRWNISFQLMLCTLEKIFGLLFLNRTIVRVLNFFFALQRKLFFHFNETKHVLIK